MEFPGNWQGAKRRAAGAISGEATERPMEPEAFSAHSCVFAVPISIIETQGMGTVVRRKAPNGEVPRPLRSLCVFVEKTLGSDPLEGRQGEDALEFGAGAGELEGIPQTITAAEGRGEIGPEFLEVAEKCVIAGCVGGVALE